jgi:small-conductance mechanosensitive channel
MTYRTSPLLRWALFADAFASGAMAVLMLSFAGALEDLLQIPARFLFNVGLILVPYAALVGYLGTRERLPTWIVWTVIAANVLWVLDSVLLALSDWIAPNTLGLAFIYAQALAVAAFAELQFIGLRRSRLLSTG